MANVMTRLAIASLLTLAGCTPVNADTEGQPATSDCSAATTCNDACMCATNDPNFCASACAGSGPQGGPMPCEIDNIVKSRCQMCHGPKLIGGAPMSLLTAGDFQQDYTVKSTPQLLGQHMKLSQLARIRLNGEMGTQRMPQGNVLPPADLALMNSWLNAGAPAGGVCGPPPPPGGGSTGAGGSGAGGWTPAPGGSYGAGGWTPAGGNNGAGGWTPQGNGGYGNNPPVGGSGNDTGAGGGPPSTGNIVRPTDPDVCAGDPTQFEPLVARPGETCYEFRVHGQSSPTDTSKFSIAPGESYSQWYYDIPWPPGTLATRFGAKFDNLQVLHHWLAFSSTSGNAAGTVVRNVTGTTLGEGAELIGGWAVGGCNVEFGADMGLKLPSTGKIMVQWHHYNNTGTNQLDGTLIQFCTVPAGGRPNVGGLTFLGTENFNGLAGMPAGRSSDFSGTCVNDSGAPITIMGWNPHMHLLGTNMKSVVTKANGQTETIFDHPFLFDHQVNYFLNPGYVLQPGDKITSTCTFNNTTTAPVAFGQSTKQEMCYQFTFSYPYGALNNGVLSLIGATNTCW